MLLPAKLMDSLIKDDRKFIRKNTFFLGFEKGVHYSVHRCKGEYINKSFSNDE